MAQRLEMALRFILIPFILHGPIMGDIGALFFAIQVVMSSKSAHQCGFIARLRPWRELICDERGPKQCWRIQIGF